MGSTSRAVTHDNFDDAIKNAVDGKTALMIPTYTRSIRIDGRVIARFAKNGNVALKKSKDGRGFLVARGRHWDYVFAGGLIEYVL